MSRKFVAVSRRGKARFQRANRSHHKANNPASELLKVNEHYTRAPYRRHDATLLSANPPVLRKPLTWPLAFVQTSTLCLPRSIRASLDRVPDRTAITLHTRSRRIRESRRSLISVRLQMHRRATVCARIQVQGVSRGKKRETPRCRGREASRCYRLVSPVLAACLLSWKTEPAGTHSPLW